MDAALIISIFGILLSIYVFIMQRTINKKQNTLEYLHRLVVDDKLVNVSNNFRDNIEYLPFKVIENDINSGEDLIDFLSGEVRRDEIVREKIEPKNQEVILLLNYFDALAIGIKVGIYDFKTAKLSRKHHIIDIFRQSKNFIERLRKESGDLNKFILLEQLAKKLESDE